MKKIQVFFRNVLEKVMLFAENIGVWYRATIQPTFSKIGYILSHNVMIHFENNRLRLFGFIRFKVTRKTRHALYGYLFISLWMVGFGVFTLYPLIYSFYLSFHNAYYNLQTGVVTTYVGFTNYLNILRSSTLVPLFTNYVGKIVIAVPLIIVFSIVIAVLVNMPIRNKGIWRSIFFLPVIISTGPVINELNAQNAIALPSIQDSDVYRYILTSLPPLLSDPLLTVINSMLLILWYAGIPILIFLAGLQKIDPSLYEAASMDGASPWMRFWKITLPSIVPFMGISIVYIVVSMSLYVEPGGILDLTRTHMLVGAPDSAFWFGYGYAAAIAWIYFFIMVIIILIFTRLVTERKQKVML